MTGRGSSGRRVPRVRARGGWALAGPTAWHVPGSFTGMGGHQLHGRREEDMLLSAKEMLKYSILATDGEIGQVSDVLVGESDLKVRYLVIDTGGWLSGRTVLVSTAWLSSVEPSLRQVVVNISKKRIEESPPYAPEVPLERDYETRLHDHYGFPYYWQM